MVNNLLIILKIIVNQNKNLGSDKKPDYNSNLNNTFNDATPKSNRNDTIHNADNNSRDNKSFEITLGIRL